MVILPFCRFFTLLLRFSIQNFSHRRSSNGVVQTHTHIQRHWIRKTSKQNGFCHFCLFRVYRLCERNRNDFFGLSLKNKQTEWATVIFVGLWIQWQCCITILRFTKVCRLFCQCYMNRVISIQCKCFLCVCVCVLKYKVVATAQISKQSFSTLNALQKHCSLHNNFRSSFYRDPHAPIEWQLFPKQDVFQAPLFINFNECSLLIVFIAQ